ncbi:MAG: DUF433 domain-containing protein [Anaerolinea sp.]|nr:DUF433 domain-containing protein [Anaerolinea sp.]
MNQNTAQAMEFFDPNTLDDMIRKIVREELEQMAMPQAASPMFIREASQVTYQAAQLSPGTSLESDIRRILRGSVASSNSAQSLGRWIVADPAICHGKPTFCGTRIMVWQVLELVAQGMAWETIEEQWNGKISKEMIAEAVRLANRSFMQQMNELTRELAVA